jgi:hypothetical protein
MKVKYGAWKNGNLSSCFHCDLVSSPISSLLFRFFVNVVDGIVILQLFVLLQVPTITYSNCILYFIFFTHFSILHSLFLRLYYNYFHCDLTYLVGF